MNAALILSAAALFGAVPAAAQPGDYSPEQTTFEGYIRFAEEEFQLIASENRYRAGASRPCVSGALPRAMQRNLGDIRGQKVRITGTTMAWSDDLPGDRYTHEGSNIRNECEGAFVILGTDIDAIP